VGLYVLSIGCIRKFENLKKIAVLKSGNTACEKQMTYDFSVLV
jgi:hypothetical protein